VIFRPLNNAVAIAEEYSTEYGGMTTMNLTSDNAVAITEVYTCSIE
jgi:hypothetical protein